MQEFHFDKDARGGFGLVVQVKFVMGRTKSRVYKQFGVAKPKFNLLTKALLLTHAK